MIVLTTGPLGNTYKTTWELAHVKLKIVYILCKTSLRPML